MMALPAHGFVMLSMPKCASTTLVTTLKGEAEILMRINPKLKHMNCRTFTNKMAPVLANAGYRRADYELVTLFREPVAWLESWWRYRQRPALKDKADGKWTGDTSFEEFAIDHVEGRPGGISGREARFVSLDDSFTIGVDRIFALERPDAWQGYIDRALGREVEMVTKNWSTSRAEPELTEATRARLREHYAPEYDIWQQLLSHDGEWAVPSGYVAGQKQ
ncbi:sulfotransferase family protein [Nocardioides acrostichi]|uniref:Sulfotransferase family protein n=1 Tax=Nocardioides acrostichi TaxID=2784339 RepID=A0A930UYJ9_9ACTN|nr:hypothetical protein [Nocardioides acrostichi]MBF4162087.1 hypothetical protein [Nocardioides acrostichi]